MGFYGSCFYVILLTINVMPHKKFSSKIRSNKQLGLGDKLIGIQGGKIFRLYFLVPLRQVLVKHFLLSSAKRFGIEAVYSLNFFYQG